MDEQKPKWYVKAKERMALMKRSAVGTDVHLLEMACADYDALALRPDELIAWECARCHYLNADRAAIFCRQCLSNREEPNT